jgi:hypothetical protein
MSDCRYKYQVIQGLDDKIGSDLRFLVASYLGPDRDRTRSYHEWVTDQVRQLRGFGSLFDILAVLRYERRQYEGAPGVPNALYLT